MTVITTKLRAWQSLEWLYSFLAGLGRWLGFVGLALALACLLDWWIDRYRETPFGLRVVLTATQLIFAAVLLWRLLIRFPVPTLDQLAIRAETYYRAYDHRLVTALQLNRKLDQLQGMSPQLLAAVTKEAEQLARNHSFTGLASPKRVWQACCFGGPILLGFGVLALVNMPLLTALLQRQALLNVDIPRSTSLKNLTAELWPAGDEVLIQIEARGAPGTAPGEAIVTPQGQPSDRYPLTLLKTTDDGAAIFTAKLPPSSIPFQFTARIADARLRRPGEIRFAPRPVVKDLNAWTVLPKYVDPTGQHRYERFQPQGEVVALPDSSVRVAIATSKPVRQAQVILLARDEAGRETRFKTLDMRLNTDGLSAEAEFSLPPKPSAYLIQVVDENGFANANLPRRGITLAPDEAPRVTLLSEVLKDPRDEGPLEDYEVNGMPIVLGGQVMIGYSAKSPLGLSRAVLQYRVNEGPWTPLPLKQTDADTTKLGPFIPELGIFRESGLTGQVEFYPVPSPDVSLEPPGLEAGGRVNFQTAALMKLLPDGKTAKLEVGDRVEFYVEVYDRNPAPGRLPGRSESRLKGVVTQAQLQAWLDQLDQSRERLRKLEEAQRGVFGKKSP